MPSRRFPDNPPPPNIPSTTKSVSMSSASSPPNHHPPNPRQPPPTNPPDRQTIPHPHPISSGIFPYSDARPIRPPSSSSSGHRHGGNGLMPSGHEAAMSSMAFPVIPNGSAGGIVQHRHAGGPYTSSPPGLNGTPSSAGRNGAQQPHYQAVRLGQSPAHQSLLPHQLQSTGRGDMESRSMDIERQMGGASREAVAGHSAPKNQRAEGSTGTSASLSRQTGFATPNGGSGHGLHAGSLGPQRRPAPPVHTYNPYSSSSTATGSAASRHNNAAAETSFRPQRLGENFAGNPAKIASGSSGAVHVTADSGNHMQRGTSGSFQAQSSSSRQSIPSSRDGLSLPVAGPAGNLSAGMPSLRQGDKQRERNGVHASPVDMQAHSRGAAYTQSKPVGIHSRSISGSSMNSAVPPYASQLQMVNAQQSQNRAAARIASLGGSSAEQRSAGHPHRPIEGPRTQPLAHAQLPPQSVAGASTSLTVARPSSAPHPGAASPPFSSYNTFAPSHSQHSRSNSGIEALLQAASEVATPAAEMKPNPMELLAPVVDKQGLDKQQKVIAIRGQRAGDMAPPPQNDPQNDFQIMVDRAISASVEQSRSGAGVESGSQQGKDELNQRRKACSDRQPKGSGSKRSVRSSEGQRGVKEISALPATLSTSRGAGITLGSGLGRDDHAVTKGKARAVEMADEAASVNDTESDLTELESSDHGSSYEAADTASSRKQSRRAPVQKEAKPPPQEGARKSQRQRRPSKRIASPSPPSESETETPGVLPSPSLQEYTNTGRMRRAAAGKADHAIQASVHHFGPVQDSARKKRRRTPSPAASNDWDQDDEDAESVRIVAASDIKPLVHRTISPVPGTASAATDMPNGTRERSELQHVGKRRKTSSQHLRVDSDDDDITDTKVDTSLLAPSDIQLAMSPRQRIQTPGDENDPAEPSTTANATSQDARSGFSLTPGANAEVVQSARQPSQTVPDDQTEIAHTHSARQRDRSAGSQGGVRDTDALPDDPSIDTSEAGGVPGRSAARAFDSPVADAVAHAAPAPAVGTDQVKSEADRLLHDTIARPTASPSSHKPKVKPNGKAKKMAKREYLFQYVMEADSSDRAIHVQDGACLLLRYVSFPKCGQCIAKKAGEPCRFDRWRSFYVTIPSLRLVERPFFADQSEQQLEDSLLFPTSRDHNRKAEQADLYRLQQCTARWLIPLISREILHVADNKAVYRPDIDDSRSICDFCSATIFKGSWACSHCGKEFCLDCRSHFDQTETSESIVKYLEGWERKAASRLLKCSRQGGVDRQHSASCLIPIGRMTLDRLKNVWVKLVAFVHRSKTPTDEILPSLDGRLANIIVEQVPRESLQELPGSAEDAARQELSASLDSRILRSLFVRHTSDSQPIDLTGIESSEFIRIEKTALKELLFDKLWSLGVPIVVDGVGADFALPWDPASFIDRVDGSDDPQDEECAIENCEDLSQSWMSAESFFRQYQDPTLREDNSVKKLKDWPSTTEFRQKFEDLYDDFHQAMPMPDYTRRDGVLNISSHFPLNGDCPDIGPKMYIAFAGHEGQGGHGSTRLHMDIADAINVLMHANPQVNGQPGCAVWDIYKPEDADKLRGFLREKFSHELIFSDPIHSQLFYLDAPLRRELFDRTGVASHRIYQYPGQAVMVPAGCAHQVCNLSDCIKVACDFVSPHNIRRCEKLSREFRNENQAIAWKDDVLQLSNMIWFAWSSCQEVVALERDGGDGKEHQSRLVTAFDREFPPSEGVRYQQCNATGHAIDKLFSLFRHGSRLVAQDSPQAAEHFAGQPQIRRAKKRARDTSPSVSEDVLPIRSQRNRKAPSRLYDDEDTPTPPPTKRSRIEGEPRPHGSEGDGVAQIASVMLAEIAAKFRPNVTDKDVFNAGLNNLITDIEAFMDMHGRPTREQWQGLLTPALLRLPFNSNPQLKPAETRGSGEPSGSGRRGEEADLITEDGSDVVVVTGSQHILNGTVEQSTGAEVGGREVMVIDD